MYYIQDFDEGDKITIYVDKERIDNAVVEYDRYHDCYYACYIKNGEQRHRPVNPNRRLVKEN